VSMFWGVFEENVGVLPPEVGVKDAFPRGE